MHALQATVLTLKQPANSVNSQPPVGRTLLGVCQLPPLQSIFLTQDSSKHRVLCKLSITTGNICHFSTQVSGSHVCQREAAAAKSQQFSR